jgi:hypothetical protein
MNAVDAGADVAFLSVEHSEDMMFPARLSSNSNALFRPGAFGKPSRGSGR